MVLLREKACAWSKNHRAQSDGGIYRSVHDEKTICGYGFGELYSICQIHGSVSGAALIVILRRLVIYQGHHA